MLESLTGSAVPVPVEVFGFLLSSEPDECTSESVEILSDEDGSSAVLLSLILLSIKLELLSFMSVSSVHPANESIAIESRSGDFT